MTESASENLLIDTTADAGAQEGGCEGHCACNGNADEAPELDVRLIPAAVRHAAIFGALSAIAPGASLILLAPHEPLPLLSQLETREPGQWSWKVEEPGPVTWRVRVTRAN